MKRAPEWPTVSKQWAEANGYRSITWFYDLTVDSERTMAQRMDKQLAGTDFVWVGWGPGVVEAYRLKSELDAICARNKADNGNYTARYTFDGNN